MLKMLAPHLDTEHQHKHKKLPDWHQLPCLSAVFGYALLPQWHTRCQSFMRGLFAKVQCKPEVFIGSNFYSHKIHQTTDGMLGREYTVETEFMGFGINLGLNHKF